MILKPKPPLCRIIREGTIGDCPQCHSTQVRKYFTNSIIQFGPKIGCIHEKCDNYFYNLERQRDRKLSKLLK